LVIGCGLFRDARVSPLPACRNDAEALAEVLRDPLVGMFPAGNVKVLVDEEVTKAAVIDALDMLSKLAGPEDLVLVFFSGHGATDEKGRAYWLMHDTAPDKLRVSGLPETEITELLGEIRTRRLVTLIDACFSAATANVSQSKSLVDLSKLYPEFKGDGRIAITASKGDQLSVVIREGNEGHGYSAFAWHVIGGLKGGAGGEDGIVTVDELWAYVKDRTEATARLQGGNQEPQLKGQLGSRFLLTVDAERLGVIAEKVQALRDLLSKKKINGAHFDEGRALLESWDGGPGRQARRKIFIDLAEGRLSPEYLDQLLAKHPIDPPQQRSPTPDPAPQITTLLQQAREAVAAREWSRASGLVDQLLALDPANPTALRLRGDVEAGRVEDVKRAKQREQEALRRQRRVALQSQIQDIDARLKSARSEQLAASRQKSSSQQAIAGLESQIDDIEDRLIPEAEERWKHWERIYYDPNTDPWTRARAQQEGLNIERFIEESRRTVKGHWVKIESLQEELQDAHDALNQWNDEVDELETQRSDLEDELKSLGHP